MYDSNATSVDSYGVLCQVDVAPAVNFRTVIYARQPSQGIFRELYEQFIVSAGAECSPVITLVSDGSSPRGYTSEIISNPVLAIGAAAPGQMFTENSYDNGWWNTLWEATQMNYNDGEYTDLFSFNNSRNPLEDVLGLVSAMTVAFHLGNQWAPEGFVQLDSGSVSASALRVGPGELWALVYVLPQIYTVILLSYFLWKRRRT